MVAPAGPGPGRTAPRASGPAAVAMISGTSPPGPLRCGSTTCRTNPAVDRRVEGVAARARASASPTARRASASRTTIPNVPCSVGRVVKVMRCSLRCRGCGRRGRCRRATPGGRRAVPSPICSSAGDLGDAAVEGQRAAGVEPAPGRRVDGPGRSSPSSTRLPGRAAVARVGDRGRGQQGLGVGMRAGAANTALAGTLFDELAEVHHGDVVGEVLHRRQVVGDEQAGETHVALQVRRGGSAPTACTETSRALVGSSATSSGVRTPGPGRC